MEANIPTREELGMVVASTPKQTPAHTYSTVVSSSTPTQAPIYSIVTTTSPVPRTLLPICDAITDTLCYPLQQSPHPTIPAKQRALMQSTMTVQLHISSPVVSPTPSFNTHLDLTDMEFLKKKTAECKEGQRQALHSDGKQNPYMLWLLLSNHCAKLQEPPEGPPAKTVAGRSRKAIDSWHTEGDCCERCWYVVTYAKRRVPWFYVYSLYGTFALNKRGCELSGAYAKCAIFIGTAS